MSLASGVHGAIDWCARRRADGIARRVGPFLPREGPILDLGSGAGHNAAALSRVFGLRVVEADLASLSRIGKGPVLYDGLRLPFRDRAFAASTLIFVLQYVADAQPLWSELRRVVAGPILVMQSMVALPSRRGILRFSDNLLGPAGCRAAAWAGYFGAEGRRPRWRVERSFDRPAFDSWIRSFGLQARLLSAGPWPVGPIRHDLFRVESR